jgi:hypothetical protein
MSLAGTTLPTAKLHEAFASGEWVCDLDHVLLAADFRGEILPLWRAWQRTLPAVQLGLSRGQDPNENALQERIDEFRYRRSLTAAEECEDWLAQRGLTPTDLRDYFVRTYWARSLSEEAHKCELLAPDSSELLSSFRKDLLLSEDFDRMARRLAWRVAASAEACGDLTIPSAPVRSATPAEALQPVSLEWAPACGAASVFKPDPRWTAELEVLEAAYEEQSVSVLTTENRRRMAGSLRLSLLRVDLELLDLESEGAAREALLCVRDDGLTLSQVAPAAGSEVRKLSALLEDLPEKWRQPVLSATFGKVVGPLVAERRYSVCRVESKREPQLERSDVQERVDKALLRQHFLELEGRHIRWRIDLEVTA